MLIRMRTVFMVSPYCLMCSLFRASVYSVEVWPGPPKVTRASAMSTPFCQLAARYMASRGHSFSCAVEGRGTGSATPHGLLVHEHCRHTPDTELCHPLQLRLSSYTMP